ncbi:MAG: hypothetical protein OEO23_14925, partial [Gemmatimonadota bacterium]|nr:hypothetical protein [Gemmatimonadota bacterium]
LVASIERANPAYLRDPFTVREIHEELIPYRTHRDLIGVAMNGDYEDGLMRLLAGEGDYLILETGQALDALRKELEGKSPDMGLFKEFPEATVRLNPALLGETRPHETRRGVAGLFGTTDTEGAGAMASGSPGDPSGASGDAKGLGPGGTLGRSGWKLGDPDPEMDEPPPASKASAREATAGGRQQVEVDSRPDQVESPGQFWSGAGSSAEDPPPGSRVDDKARSLEAENRRLKILLAERVLEVEELRERLDRRGAGGRREKP